jgi:hypothetical protein
MIKSNMTMPYVATLGFTTSAAAVVIVRSGGRRLPNVMTA